MTGQQQPVMPDPRKLVRRSIGTAMRAAGLSRREAAIAVECVASAMCQSMPGEATMAYPWAFDVLLAASEAVARTRPA